MRLLVCAVGVLVAVSLSGCDKFMKPAGEVCGSAETAQTLDQMIFTVGQRQIDRNVDYGVDVDWPALNKQFDTLKNDKLFSVENVLFKNKDDGTGMVTCQASIAIHLPAKYKNGKYRSYAGQINNLRYPAEAFEHDAAVPITYTVQTEVSGKRDVVSSDDLSPLGDLLFALSFAKWLDQASGGSDSQSSASVDYVPAVAPAMANDPK